MLTPLETFWLRWHADHSPAPLAQMARVVLAANSGASPAAIAETQGVSEGEAAAALDTYAAKRLNALPRPMLSVDEILAAAQADREHAERTAQLATALFDAARPVHRLPATLRPLLASAAQLHDVGLRIDPAQHQCAGRDLLRGLQLTGYTFPQQTIIACIVSFHRKKVRPYEESLFATLSQTHRHQTLALAALVRVADSLAENGVTKFARVIITPARVTLELATEKAGHSARILKKADLWNTVFKMPIHVAVTAKPVDIAGWAELPLNPSLPTSQAAQHILAATLARWQAHQAAALAGDETALQSVDACVTSIRCALRLFAACCDPRAVKSLRPPLKEIEKSLERVRRSRFWLADAEAYRAEFGREAGAAHLLETWQKDQGEVVAEAVACLSGTGVADVWTALTSLIAAKPMGSNEPLRLSLGPMFETLVAEVAERESGLTRDNPASYARLGNSIQRCQCALDFFAQLWPAAAAQPLAADLARLQDRLDTLDQYHRLQARLARFLDAWARQQAVHKAPQLHNAHSVLGYSDSRRAAWENNLHELKADVAPVRPARLRQRLTALLEIAAAAPTPS